MNRRFATISLIAVFVIGLLSLTCLSGCETAKGMGRDIKDADEWIKDHLW
jgi:predicted small secreted protein